MKIAFTDFSIRALKPTDSRDTYWDAALPGFALRVGKRQKTFFAMRGKTRERVTIGHYPSMALQEARRQAKLILATLADHRPSISFDEAVRLFQTTHCALLRKSTQREMDRIFQRHFQFQKPLAKITRQDIQSVLDGLRATPSEANHAFKVMRTFFNWAARRGDIESNPISGLGMPMKERSRERVLTLEELKAVWFAATDHPFGTIVRLLILTGLRRSEIQHVSVDGDIGTIPADYVKNGRTHNFPLCEMAKPLFATNLTFNGWSKSKARLDKASGIAPWTLHDLRRTYATIHASLGTPPHVIERLLNHVSGTISGVAAIYNRFQYTSEMRAAVTAYEAHIAKLIEA